MNWPATHRSAALLLVGCAVLWSSAGVLSRLLQVTEGFEMTFWRSFFCVLTMGVILAIQERGHLLRPVLATGWMGVLSGLMWAVMFTCFMLASSATPGAKALFVIGLSPLLAALLGRIVLGQQIRTRTWLAISAAAVGIWWMVRGALSSDGIGGLLIATGVPIASAINLVMLRRLHARIDLAPAVMIGALLSCLITLPWAWPFTAGTQDLLILAILGAFQLALPCWLMVRAMRHLAPHEAALIALLEVVLGPLWVWLGVGEATPAATLQGGVLVIGALALNALTTSAAEPATKRVT